MDDMIETLLGLTDEINKLKAESAMLSEQSREVMIPFTPYLI